MCFSRVRKKTILSEQTTSHPQKHTVMIEMQPLNEPKLKDQATSSNVEVQELITRLINN